MILEYVVDVNIHDAYADGPNAAVIKMSPGLLRRVRSLTKCVKKLKVWQIRDFDYTPEFKFKMEENLEDEDTSIDTLLLQVTDMSIGWSGYIKHTDVEISTDDLNLKEINENQKILRAKVLPPLMIKGKLKYESSQLILHERLKGGDLPQTLRVNAGVILED
jgi:hypothetical protein